ncbi:MAG: FecR family protein [Aestuariibaculum sp.]
MENIILKYLNDSLTEAEHQQLCTWLKNKKNKEKFKAFIKTNYDLSIVYNDVDETEALRQIKRNIAQKQKKMVKRRPYYKYVSAAVFIGVLLAVSLFLKKDGNTGLPHDKKTTKAVSTIKPGKEKAILTLGDGSEVILNEGTEYSNQNSKSNSKGIVYTNKTDKTTEVTYNYMTIPRGGQYFLQLSDGTKVWLNSESQLKYPVTFINGQPRTVELVYGEAYFKVSHSNNHNGSIFNVLTKQQEVNVLGTEFNIKAYKDESHVYTTLVNGKVVLNIEQETKPLLPNQQCVLDLGNNSITIKKVDAYAETCWKEGLFSFKNKSLKEITVVLSRWYNIDVVFENSKSENLMFSGVLKKNQGIDEILNIINETNLINAYEIKDKTITIK